MSNDMNVKDQYKKNLPLSKWLIETKSEIANRYATEDSNKRARLELLRAVADISVAWSREFRVSTVKEINEAIDSIIVSTKDRLIGVRITGLADDGSVIRTRGITCEDARAWIQEKCKGFHAEIRIEFSSHVDNATCSMIFVVDEGGVAGDVVAGDPQQLTQGEVGSSEITQFYFDFTTFRWSSEIGNEIERSVKETIARIKVPRKEVRDSLASTVGAAFVDEYLKGYFETVDSIEWGTTFLDYNRELSKLPPMQMANEQDHSKVVAKGSPASPGVVRGVARVISDEQVQLESHDFKKGDVLVCKMTSGIHLPLLNLAGGVVTDMGGVLSHAAIVCRELSIPCIAGAKDATKTIKDGQCILLDATKGLVMHAPK